MKKSTLRRWWWLALLVPVLVGLARLRFDVEVLNLLPQGLPSVQGLKIFQQSFANANELVVTVEGAEAEQAEAGARGLAQALRAETNLVAQATWQAPWSEHPEQAAELIAYLWLNQPPEVFGLLTNRFAGTNMPAFLQETRDRLANSLSPTDLGRLAYDPFDLMQLPESSGANAGSFGNPDALFASSDGTFRLVYAQSAVDLGNYKACVNWLGEIKARTKAWQQADPSRAALRIHFTGRPAFVAEISSSMQQDMAGPSGWTLAIIGVLFYISHRRWRPLLWLLTLLAVILGVTLALSGLFFASLNVVSLGFASILLGLAEDFGIVLYQEWRVHPHLSAAEVRREAAPGVFWSTVTTAGAFLLLNLSGLPGLGQLGSLVALGIVVAAFVMLYGYLPPLVRKAQKSGAEGKDDAPHALAPSRSLGPWDKAPFYWWLTFLLLAAGAFTLLKRFPEFDKSPDSLRPKNSEAYATLDTIKKRMSQQKEPLWLVAKGRDTSDVLAELKAAESVLAKAKSDKIVSNYNLPTILWPDEKAQQSNRETISSLLQSRGAIAPAVAEAGFTTNSLLLTERIFDTWKAASETARIFVPTNANSRWIFDKFMTRHGNNPVALGLVYPETGANGDSLFRISDELGRITDARGINPIRQAPSPDAIRSGNESGRAVLLSGWELLGASISAQVMRELPKVMVPIVLVVVVSLWLAFRNLKDVLLSLGTLVFGGLLLVMIMSWLGWSWNMLNLMSLPLLLGMGVDFSIHMQLSMRKSDGDLSHVRSSVGRALLLAGSTTVAGFGSLAFSSNAGMASLGRICAIGIACSMFTAIVLLPWWRAALIPRGAPAAPAHPKAAPR